MALLSGPAYAATAPVPLGTDGSYAVLGGSTVANTGPSVLNGDLGLSPGASVTGFPPGAIHGARHVADAAALQAQSDLVTAYNDAAGRAPTSSVAGDLTGLTLTQGVYRSAGALGFTGTLTLDAQGDPNAVFIFQVASNLTTGSASNLALIGGARADNVFWQVGSSATLGTRSSFRGNILALTSIAAQTGAMIEGRALAHNGGVTLDANTISRADNGPTPTPTATPTGGWPGGGGGPGGGGWPGGHGRPGGGGPVGAIGAGGGGSVREMDPTEIIGGSTLLAAVAAGFGVRFLRRRATRDAAS
ncbi:MULTISPECIES: ice-binding family protein [unclassified Kitasatospora]|uniref:ice-binding family protein n=1 Tax=unclassified Kitasatospora TaxID=2633591 RepID=UPI002474993B|nr:ice-binding family protein [Kitasatospora sp. MAP12-44]